MTYDSPRYENPSARKFDPPPPHASSDPSPARRYTLVGLVLTACVFVASWLLERPASRGMAWLLAGALLVLSVLEFIVARKHADALDGADPYTPDTKITR